MRIDMRNQEKATCQIVCMIEKPSFFRLRMSVQARRTGYRELTASGQSSRTFSDNSDTVRRPNLGVRYHGIHSTFFKDQAEGLIRER